MIRPITRSKASFRKASDHFYVDPPRAIDLIEQVATFTEGAVPHEEMVADTRSRREHQPAPMSDRVMELMTAAIRAMSVHQDE
jgi:hypothetical protein